MKRVYLADSKTDERSALRLLMKDLNLKIVGEGADWLTVFTQAPQTLADVILIDWELIATEAGASLLELRQACPAAVVIVLISHLDARQQAALSAGADAFISKGETSERIVAGLRLAVGDAAL